MRHFFLSLLFTLGVAFFAQAQVKTDFNRQDSLRGSLNPMRTAFDVHFYKLHLRILPEQQAIQGSNEVHFQLKNATQKIQLDLFENLEIDSVLFKGNPVSFQREGNAFFIQFPDTLPAGELTQLTIYYGGKPIIAERPPWDGGFSWEKDQKGNDWIAVSCEGIGASLWWPNKDHPTEEPDSMAISFEVPDKLMAVANGNLRNTEKLGDGFKRYDWFVNYPINNYNVTLNAAVYEHFSETYTSQQGDQLALDYYVLAYNLDKAKEQFKQVPPMLRCFEQLYGKYPFWEDGYALVETPYWGMEHQSAVAYGNNYQNNDYGFDFIIVHESGHEYWGNSITETDHAEMWIHESFTTYTDALFTECRFGYETYLEYMAEMKTKIKNQHPILAPKGVNYNYWPDADMYYKGAWMLHSIRNSLKNDQQWFDLLRQTYQHFKRSHVSTEELIAYMDKHSDYALQPIFDQYLKGIEPPELEYTLQRKGRKVTLQYRWVTDYADDFSMPLKLKFGEGKYRTIYPAAQWKETTFRKVAKDESPQFAHELYYFKEKHKN